MSSSIYDFKVIDGNGSEISLNDYKNRVLLIVNVASKCGLTPQYKGLQKLYDELNTEGLDIIGFPCNQFAAQEPGNHNQITSFCESIYSVKFPIFKKIKVNGPDADPLYKFLKDQAPGLLGTRSIKWNFTKFLISKNGNKIVRFGPNKQPSDFKDRVISFLKSS